LRPGIHERPVGQSSCTSLFDSDALPSRIFDLGNLANSRWMVAPGQSGLLLNPHYDDCIYDWQQVEYRPMLFTPRSIDDHATERLTLRP